MPYTKGGNMAENNDQQLQEPKKKFSLENVGTGAWIGIAVVALVLGLLIGRFLLGGGAGGALGKAKLSESELNNNIATYSYKGKTENINARQVIEQSSSLESAKDADGNYAVPSADTVLSYARNAIIGEEAKSRNINVSDDDLKAYAEEMMGSSDFASIASSYGMDENTVKETLRQSAMMNKLRDEIVKTDNTAAAPEAPKAPEGANSEDQAARDAAMKTASADYANYIIKLAGDEWDAEKGAWKSPDGPYATALAEYQVTKDSATYEAAQAAYYVAYQDYSTKQSEVSTQWTDFVNGLLGNASIQLSSLVA